MEIPEELACYIASELENMDEFNADEITYPPPAAWLRAPSIVVTVIDGRKFAVTITEED